MQGWNSAPSWPPGTHRMRTVGVCECGRFCWSQKGPWEGPMVPAHRPSPSAVIPVPKAAPGTLPTAVSQPPTYTQHSLCLSVGSDCCHKRPQPGWHKRHTFFSQFWRLRAQGQGASQVGFWCRQRATFLLCMSLPSLPSAHREWGGEWGRRGLSFWGSFLFVGGHLSCWIRAPPSWPPLTLITSLEALSH